MMEAGGKAKDARPDMGLGTSHPATLRPPAAIEGPGRAASLLGTLQEFRFPEILCGDLSTARDSGSGPWPVYVRDAVMRLCRAVSSSWVGILP